MESNAYMKSIEDREWSEEKKMAIKKMLNTRKLRLSLPSTLDLEKMMETRLLWSSLSCTLDLILDLNLWRKFTLFELKLALTTCRKLWLSITEYLETEYFFRPTYSKVQYFLPHKVYASSLRHINEFSPSITHLTISSFPHSPSPIRLPHSLSHLCIFNYGYQTLSFNSPLLVLSIYSQNYPMKKPDYSFWSERQFLASLPSSLFQLDLGYGFNLPASSLPHSIKNLSLPFTYQKSLDKLPPSLSLLHVRGKNCPSLSSLPNTLQKLKIEYDKYEFDLNHLPPNLTTLEVFGQFNKSFSNLSPSLTSLTVSTMVPTIISGLPPSLTKLCLSEGYSELNQPLHQLPNLKYFSFPRYFSLGKLDLENFPQNLSTLILPQYFDSSLNSLPSSLTTLYFGNSFNQPIDHLPPHLLELRLGQQFNHPVDNLPSSLLYLSFLRNSSFNHPIDKLPSALFSLILYTPNFNHSLNNLPSSLAHFEISNFPFTTNIAKDIFSFTPVDIYFGDITRYDQLSPKVIFTNPITSFPSLTTLLLNNTFNYPLPPLPPSLITLYLGDYFTHPLPNLINSILQKLILGRRFQHPLPVLPSSLKGLALGYNNYSHPLSLPPYLLSLAIHGSYPITHLKDKPEFLKIYWL